MNDITQNLTKATIELYERQGYMLLLDFKRTPLSECFISISIQKSEQVLYKSAVRLITYDSTSTNVNEAIVSAAVDAFGGNWQELFETIVAVEIVPMLNQLQALCSTVMGDKTLQTDGVFYDDEISQEDIDYTLMQAPIPLPDNTDTVTSSNLHSDNDIYSAASQLNALKYQFISADHFTKYPDDSQEKEKNWELTKTELQAQIMDIITPMVACPMRFSTEGYTPPANTSKDMGAWLPMCINQFIYESMSSIRFNDSDDDIRTTQYQKPLLSDEEVDSMSNELITLKQLLDKTLYEALSEHNIKAVRANKMQQANDMLCNIQNLVSLFESCKVRFPFGISPLAHELDASSDHCTTIGQVEQCFIHVKSTITPF